jgi:hypothetical protein
MSTKKQGNKRTASAAQAEREKGGREEYEGPTKITRGPLPISRAIAPRVLDSALEPKEFVFLLASGSKAHCNIQWYMKRRGGSDVCESLYFDLLEERKLPFGVTSYRPKDAPSNVTSTAALTVAVPLSEELYASDSLLIPRLLELEAILRAYMVSADAADAWAKVGLVQPSSVEELHWNSIINEWSAKRTGEKFTDIRLKFHREFNGQATYSATDCRVEGKEVPADLNDIKPNERMKGIFTFGPLYLRPTPRGKVPYSCGVTPMATRVSFYHDPEALTKVVD